LNDILKSFKNSKITPKQTKNQKIVKNQKYIYGGPKWKNQKADNSKNLKILKIKISKNSKSHVRGPQIIKENRKQTIVRIGKH